MSVSILGTGLAERGAALETSLDRLRRLPAFRKATRNMMMTHHAVSEAIGESGHQLDELQEASFVLGSSYGELGEHQRVFEVVGAAQSRPSLPLSEQSSQWDAWLSDARFSLPGPSFTVSHCHYTGEKALELAFDLISGGIANVVIVAAVDVMSPELTPGLLPLLPVGRSWEDGAAAVVLSSNEYAERRGIVPRSQLVSVEYGVRNASKYPAPPAFYDSDALERLVLSIRTANQQIQELVLPKSNGAASRILVTRNL